MNLIRNKINLAKHFHISPSEIDRMYYWEYEFMLEEVNAHIKSENERQEKENDNYSKNFNPKNYTKNLNNSMPKMTAPKVPKMSF